jgi:integral membrane protein (TIGR01906 family)
VNALGGRLTSTLIGLATAIVIVTMAVLPFLTPQWVGFEQGRANATAWTGYSTEELRVATDAILADLVFGPPDFDVEVGGEPVLVERERGHMRDVRSVFIGLWLLAAVSILVLVVAAVRGDRGAVWRSVRRGALVLAGAVVVLGVVAMVAFDALFEVFHTVLFPAGSFTFDPATERLVQLFPFQFWQETAIAVGAVIIALALAIAVFAGRRAPRSTTAAEAAGLAATPEPSR